MTLSVSVLITAHNRAPFLPDAITSVRAQSHRVREIIVLDDGSSDGTAALVQSLGGDIRYAFQPNAGDGAARNSALALARGQLIAFLDADDAWPPERTAVLLSRLEPDPDLDIVAGRGRVFRDEPWTAALEPGPGRPEAYTMSFGTTLIRRRVFDRIGLIDSARVLATDFDWFLRCREQGVSIRRVDHVVQLYRRHDGNLSGDTARSVSGLMRVAKLALDRRRREGQAAALAPWSSLPGNDT